MKLPQEEEEEEDMKHRTPGMPMAYNILLWILLCAILSFCLPHPAHFSILPLILLLFSNITTDLDMGVAPCAAPWATRAMPAATALISLPAPGRRRDGRWGSGQEGTSSRSAAWLLCPFGDRALPTSC